MRTPVLREHTVMVEKRSERCKREAWEREICHGWNYISPLQGFDNIPIISWH
jgi:hypothetical protein